MSFSLPFSPSPIPLSFSLTFIGIVAGMLTGLLAFAAHLSRASSTLKPSPLEKNKLHHVKTCWSRSQRVSTMESGISNHYHPALLWSQGWSCSALCSPGSLFILMIMPASYKQVHTDYSQKPREEARAAFTRQKGICGAPSPRLFFPFPRSRCAIEALALPHFCANEEVMAGSGDRIGISRGRAVCGPERWTLAQYQIGSHKN